MKSNTLSWKIKSNRDKLIESLSNNQVSLVTTDTILGLLAPLTPVGRDRLNLIKGRFEKPYLILIPSKKDLSAFIDQEISPMVQKVIDHCWPGPVTIIFRGKPEFSSLVQSKNGTIALRAPDHEGLCDILKHFRGLFSTSANKTGRPFPQVMNEVDPEIRGAVAYIVTDAEKERPIPSTILDCSGSEITLVRQGAYPIATLEEIIGKKLSAI